MKGILLMFVILVHGFIMDSVDAGLIGYKYAVILAAFDLVAFCIFLMVQKKKSAVSRKYNGQAHKEHTTYNHHKYTPKKGGVSSV